MSREPTGSSGPLSTDESPEGVAVPSDNPYRSPIAPAARGLGVAGAGVGRRGFRQIRWAALWATVGLSCSVALAVISNFVILTVHGLPGLVPGVVGQRVDYGWLAVLINESERFLPLITGVPFLIWFHRCYRNLPWLYVAETRYSSRWAVGGWFIPIFNLIRPYQVAREIWDASNPDVSAAEGPQGWLAKRSARLVQLWWALHVTPMFVTYIASWLLRQSSMDEWIAGTWLLLIANLVNGCAATAAILVIRGVNERQAGRLHRLHAIFAGHPLAHLGPAQASPPAKVDGVG